MERDIQANELKRILLCINALDKAISLSQLSRLTGIVDVSQIQFLLCTLEEDGLVRLEKFTEDWLVCGTRSMLLSEDDGGFSETYRQDAGEAITERKDETPIRDVTISNLAEVLDSEKILLSMNSSTSLISSEKLQLINRASGGDTKAWNQLVQHYFPKLRAIARARARSDFVDLFQIGSIGLIKGVKTFNSSKSSNPDQHISLAINREINKYVDNNRECIRLSQGINRAKRKIEKSGKQLSRRLERDPSEHELAIDTRLTEKKVRKINQYLSSHSIVSLNETLAETDEQIPLNEAVAYECSYETFDVDSVLRPEMAEEFAKLREKEKLVLHLRYGLENTKVKTLEEIGNLLGVSKQRVKQIEARALSKLNSAKIRQFAQDCYNIATNVAKPMTRSAGQLFKRSIDVLKPIVARTTKDELYSVVLTYTKDHRGHCKTAVLLSFLSDKIWFWLNTTHSECEEIAYWTVQHLCFERLLREAFSGTELVLTERGWAWQTSSARIDVEADKGVKTNNQSLV